MTFTAAASLYDLNCFFFKLLSTDDSLNFAKLLVLVVDDLLLWADHPLLILDELALDGAQLSLPSSSVSFFHL